MCNVFIGCPHLVVIASLIVVNFIHSQAHMALLGGAERSLAVRSLVRPLFNLIVRHRILLATQLKDRLAIIDLDFYLALMGQRAVARWTGRRRLWWYLIILLISTRRNLWLSRR